MTVISPARQTELAETTQTRPVFVIGAPKAGSALLAWALSQHRNLRAVTGTEWIAALCDALGSAAVQGRRVAEARDSITAVGQLHQAGIDETLFWSSFGGTVHEIVAATVTGGTVVPAYADGPSARLSARWIDAAPDNDRLVYPLSQLFGGSRFIHLLRRPETAVAAMSTRSRPNVSPLAPAAACKRWIEAATNGRDAEEALGSQRVLRVSFEELIDRPEEMLGRCLTFLGEQWDPACLRPLHGSAPEPGLPPCDLDDIPKGGEAAALADTLHRAGQRHGPGDTETLDRLAAAFHRRQTSREVQTPKRAERRDPAAVDRVRTFVANATPAGSTITVISRGDDRLLRHPGRTSWHFPRDAAGVWAGYHPADSAEALTHLEQQRAAGAGYLLLPEPSMWWLDYYTELRHHLLERYAVVAFQTDAGVLFDLSATPQETAGLSVHYRQPVLSGEPVATRRRAVASGACDDLARLFTGAVDQFVLTDDDADPAPTGWPVRESGPWRLATHPRLPVHDLIGADGEHAGWLIGYVVRPDGRLQDGTVRLAFHPGEHPVAAFEDELYRFAGRFACVLLTPGVSRLYMDAGATLGAVYSTRQRLVASTTSLVRALREGTTFVRPALDAFPADRENQFFPAGLTHTETIRRVLPNHCLDLSHWTTHRHWPRGAPARGADIDIVGPVNTIASALQATIGAVAAGHDLYVPVTAGRDSRVVLASASHASSSVSTFTFDYGPTKPTDVIDVAAGRALAAAAGVPHQVVAVADPTDDERADYLFRIGHAGHWGKSRDFFGAAGRDLKLGRALVLGFCGEMGRGSYWPNMPKRLESLQADVLLDRMKLPATERLRRAMTQWLDGLGDVDAYLLLDLLHLEQRIGCWVGPHLYGFAPFSQIVVPFCSRTIFEQMLQLPVEYRRKKRLADDLVALTWPQIGHMPYQALPGSASNGSGGP